MKRLNSQLQQDGAPLELILLIRTLLAGCKKISFRVSQGALAGVLGSTLSENVQGETQQKLDVFADEQFISALKNGGEACAIACASTNWPSSMMIPFCSAIGINSSGSMAPSSGLFQRNSDSKPCRCPLSTVN